MKVKKQTKSKILSIRVATRMVKLARQYKIDNADLFRESLEKELAKLKGKCPTCDQKVKEAKWLSI